MYICSHMLCVPILHVYLLSVSVYLCIILICDMKQTDVECVILKQLLLTMYIHFLSQQNVLNKVRF